MSEPRYCARCAREIEPGDAYCGGCGTAVPRMTETPEPMPQPGMLTREDMERFRKEDELRDAKNSAYYGCGLLVAIAFFVVMYVVFGYR